jgi:hypothetical protein
VRALVAIRSLADFDGPDFAAVQFDLGVEHKIKDFSATGEAIEHTQRITSRPSSNVLVAQAAGGGSAPNCIGAFYV